MRVSSELLECKVESKVKGKYVFSFQISRSVRVPMFLCLQAHGISLTGKAGSSDNTGSTTSHLSPRSKITKQIYRPSRAPDEPLQDLDILRCQKCQKYLQLSLSRILPVPASHAQYNREPAISTAALSSLGHSSDRTRPLPTSEAISEPYHYHR